MNSRLFVAMLLVGSLFALTAEATGPPAAKGGNPNDQPPSIIDDDEIARCIGDTYHRDHERPESGCLKIKNPHFGQLSPITTCESGGSGARNCDGCYACCNGIRDGQRYCLCGSSTACKVAADNARLTCQGNCTASFEGDGCTSPNLRL